VLPLELPIPQDWTYLILRLAFVGIIYLFLWQVVRITLRDLKSAAQQEPVRIRAKRAKIIVSDPASSNLSPGFAFSVGHKATVGRRTDCAIVIEEPSVSALHAQFEARNHAWYLTDLGSTNGTFVNGRQISGSVYVETDDVVQFGRMSFQFVA
jgi:pSer/pThr/pTyr-binding forkhead associated (FHA) protein